MTLLINSPTRKPEALVLSCADIRFYVAFRDFRFLCSFVALNIFTSACIIQIREGLKKNQKKIWIYPYSKLIKNNMALDFKNTTFLRPTFSPKNRLNTFYRKMNTAWFQKISMAAENHDQSMGYLDFWVAIRGMPLGG